MSASSAAPALLLEHLVARYEALLPSLSAKELPNDHVVRELMAVRDRVASLARMPEALAPGLLDKICSLDDRLRQFSGRLKLRGALSLEALRDVLQPPKQNWWWYQDRPSALWTIAAGLCLAVSVTMITDFSRRMLASDPDELGILSIAVQALLAVGASTTFTESGQAWVESLFRHFGIRKKFQVEWKLFATFALMVVVFVVWKWGPPQLAVLYNNRAFQKRTSDPASSVRGYQRAIQLAPERPEFHFNLAELYERDYQYDKASSEYQQAIMFNVSHVKAYANLARVLILENQPLAALRVTDDAGGYLSPDPNTTAGLYKNRAWAEYEMGFYSQAENDAQRALASSASAISAYCVLGKIYAKTGDTAKAHAAWQHFNAGINAKLLGTGMIEPDCKRLAEAAKHDHN